MTADERAAKIQASIPEDAFARLTRGQDDLEADLKVILINVWGVGYSEGLAAGARLFRDAVLERTAE